ncbi:aspartic peptidase domain-containing protein [Podospora didyma]|uniref:Aspartic peptidase domain-containing protein n=1 Tax=Podospora didyma TaxID=330526 RepID=A0AAE0NQ11_9PEZI|nr:aspartic peptidase domain-containing protein [Podospora didyma]
MLANAVTCILLSAAACCSGALIPDSPPVPRANNQAPAAAVHPAAEAGLIGPAGPPRKPGYVRMPVSRHVFNGTGKWRWGWHWSPPPGAPGGPQWPGGPGGGGFPGPGPGQGTGGPRPWQSTQYGSRPFYQPTGSPFQPTIPGWPPAQQSGAGGGPQWSSNFPTPSGFPQPNPSVSGRPPYLAPTMASSFSTVTRIPPPAQQSTQPTSLAATAQLAIARRATSDRRWGWQHLEDLGGIAYILQLDIGTPPQKIKVFIDTGSYELWVNPRCNTSADATLCQSYGNYYPAKSNSSYYVGGDFAVTYGTGAVKGSYWSDIMNIAMFQIPQVQFAVASDSNYTFSGILGLGYSYPYSINYPSVLDLMVSQKLISAPIFSLGLGGEQDGFSEIIFGGVNRWKFAGPLEPVSIWPPISQQDPNWIQYWVNVTSVGMTKPGQNPVIYTARDTFTMPTLIDTGSTLSYIREDLVAQIGQQFQATIDTAGNYIVDCAYRNASIPGTVDFGFNRGRMVISVRYKDFIYQQYPGHCMLGVQPADVGSTNYVLGDTFIRGAYLVFDQQSDVVWMNQYYNCGDGVATVGVTARDTKNIIGAC